MQVTLVEYAMHGSVVVVDVVEVVCSQSSYAHVHWAIMQAYCSVWNEHATVVVVVVVDVVEVVCSQSSYAHVHWAIMQAYCSVWNEHATVVVVVVVDVVEVVCSQSSYAHVHWAIMQAYCSVWNEHATVVVVVVVVVVASYTCRRTSCPLPTVHRSATYAHVRSMPTCLVLLRRVDGPYIQRHKTKKKGVFIMKFQR